MLHPMVVLVMNIVYSLDIITTITLSPDNQYIIIGSEKSIKIFDFKKKTEVVSFKAAHSSRLILSLYIYKNLQFIDF